MFNVDKYQDQFTYYELQDLAAGSRVKLVPERGGIVVGFSLGDQELLYLDKETLNNPEQNVRGGIPYLFPICGRLSDDEYTWNGEKYRMNQHGLARNLPWTVLNQDTREEVAITLQLKGDRATRSQYPFDFELDFKYSLKGKTLRIDQEYRNCSGVELPFYAGFHPYIRVAEKERLIYDISASAYLDFEDLRIKPYTGNLDLTHENQAKLFMDHAPGRLSFRDPVLNRKFHYEYGPEFKYPVLWTIPGQDFVCVELFMARPDALNTREDLIFIPPHRTHQTFVAITAELTK